MGTDRNSSGADGAVVADRDGTTGPAAVAFPWSHADPLPRRQVRVPVLLSLAGDVLATSVGAVAATAVLPWAPRPSAAALAVVLAVCLSSYAACGLYDRSRLAAPGAELLKVVQAGFVALGALLATAVLLEYVPSRTMLVVGAPLLVCCLAVVRTSIRIVARRMQQRGMLGTTTLVVGTNGEARAIARTINRTGWLGYRVVGFVHARSGDVGDVCDGMPVVGGLDDIDEVLLATRAGALVVTTSDVAADRLPVLVELADRGFEIRTTAAFRNTNPARITVDSLDGIPLVAVRPRRLVSTQERAKRVVDLAVGSVLLVLSAPLMAAVAVAIRLTSGPGVIFRQQRIGHRGRPFTMYKFRTMVADAEGLVVDLRDANAADGLLFKVPEDPRTTRIGRFLRRTDLDELPQLLNVLRGDMSMVGPRPALPDEVERYQGDIARRLEVKPGLTGLWQVSGRHDLQWDDYIRYDTYYAGNWSVGLDLAVCARTLPALASHRGQVPSERR